MSGSQSVRINLNLLRAFDAVARHLSFSRAGVELGRSQSTVSNQIRELEHQLSFRLLERTTRQVALTEAGEALAANAKVAFEALSAGVETARATADKRQGQIIVACAPSLSGARLPAILAAFREQDSTTHIDVEELTAREIVEAVAAGRADFGLGPCVQPVPADVSFTSAVQDPLVVVLQARFATGNSDAVPFEVLATLPLITLSGSVLLQQNLDDAAAELGLRLSARTEVRHVQTAINMARAGVGAAIVPCLSLPTPVGAGVLALPLAPPLAREVGIIAPRGRRLSPASAKLARFISSAMVRDTSPKPKKAERQRKLEP